MSDQPRIDLSQSVSKFKAAVRPKADVVRSEGFRKRLPYYAAAAIVVICTLAWIDGGEEPLHSITQSVDLATKAEGA